MNEVLRDNYVEDCENVTKRWNRVLEKAGRSERLTLPHRRFHRQIGIYSGHRFDPTGRPISESEWEENRDRWIPTESDREYVLGLMHGVFEPGRIAGWIAPPPKGIKEKPFEFEYVRR
jgi:benzoyl-CoA 2,3-dioxygenase component B